jgi:hypothetical protein
VNKGSPDSFIDFSRDRRNKMVDETEKPQEQVTTPPTDAQEPVLAADEGPEGRVEETKRAAETEVRQEKKGRLIGAALIATVVVSFLALAVAGVVQLTTRWMITCPTDLPVNDPEPVLWSAATSPDVKAQPLGVAEKILEQSRFKQK